MKQKNLIVSAILALTFGLTFSQSLYVTETSGTETEHPLANISKLTFSGGNVLVNGASSGSYALTGVRKLTFKPGTTDPGTGGGDCLNLNSDFSAGLDGWANWTNSGTTADFAEVAGEYAIKNIVGATARWHAQISQNYNFVQDTPYTISFDARSTTDKPIGVLIRECVAGDCDTADSYKDFTVTTTTQTFTFDYTQIEPTYVYGQLIFEASENTSDIFFDNICISEKTLSAPKVLASNETFRIYPNPAGDVLNLNLPEAGTIDIYSIDGKLLMSNKVNTVGSSTLNVANLTSGIYVCRYTNSKETKTIKLAKL